MLLAELERLLTEKPPHFSILSHLWDETGERLALSKVITQTSVHTQSSTWQVLVCRKRFIWGYIGTDPAGQAVTKNKSQHIAESKQ